MKRPLGLLVTVLLFDCSTSTSNGPSAPPSAATLPGEICDPTNSTPRSLRFDPPRVVLAPGQTRSVTVTVDPDVCNTPQATFTVADAGIAQAPAPATFDFRHATYSFTVSGGGLGTTTLSASIPMAPVSVPGTMQLVPSTDPPATATLEVEVRDGAAATCQPTDTAQQALDAGHLVLKGTASLGNATLTVAVGAFTQTDATALPPFTASVACASDMTATAPGKPLALGPAVTFTGQAPLPQNTSLRHEVELAIPVNPAAFPSAARMRHLQVLFSSPRAKAPRPITIANPRIEKAADGSYALKFSSPWIGTYQAAVAPDAGTRHRSRKLTHRAVVGFSMGAMGASVFGLRHHDQFDAIAPMGGPADWSWLLWYIENYALAGFCTADNPGCTKYGPGQYPIDGPFVHTMDFNHFWYEPGSGNGGRFPRSEYLQIFQDLSIMMGSAAGQNKDPNLWFFPAGPKATDPWVVGDTTGMPAGVDCKITVDPISNDPGETQQQKFQDQCYAYRCALDENGRLKNGYVAPTGYYDAKYNPDGKLPVISFCDAMVPDDEKDPKKASVPPYKDQWTQPGPTGAAPVMISLAVDLNGNGVRDQDEPVINQGHEAYDDTGVDGLFDAQEPGYDAVANPDPNQDDYDYQLNPNGTEGNHRHEDPEPYKDFGLDGVPDTAFSNVAGDTGESDGKYTQSKGLDGFYANDANGMIKQWNTAIPAGPLTDDAFMRFDVWTDGGVRDLMNFAVSSAHMTGALAGRRRADGTQLRSTAYYDGFDYLPGQTIGKPQNYVGANLLWADIPDFPSVRYGTVDASPDVVARGDGQHVGTADQLLDRLETSFYFVGKSWPDADRSQTELARDNQETSTNNEQGVDCEVQGRCEKIFTGPKTNRTGPIAITLPPGYANEANRARGVRYPVLYVLHGYGQDPRDLEAGALLTNNFMNAAEKSYATRMPKFIVVYVDGRCRIAANGKPECIRGTFWNESPQPDGPKMDSWFMEVVDYVDQNYRTMAPSTVDVTD